MLGHTIEPMLCQAVGIVAHIFLNWLLVWKYEYGVTGAGIATSIANLFIYWMLLQVTKNLEDIKGAIVEPKLSSARDIIEYLKLGIPSAFMLAIEVWAQELMNLEAGLFSVNAQAANVILVNVFILVLMFSYGMQ